MTTLKRAKRCLSTAPRNLGTYIERYGQGAVIGGTTMLVLPYVVTSLGPGDKYEPLSVVVLFGVIVGLLGGGAAAVVFGQTDNYGSTQGAWAGVMAAILYGLYRTVQNVTLNESVDAVTVATDILFGLVGILSLALAFIVFGLLGGYIGHGIRRRTKGDQPGQPT